MDYNKSLVDSISNIIKKAMLDYDKSIRTWDNQYLCSINSEATNDILSIIRKLNTPVQSEIQYKNGKVDRRFTEQWASSGTINIDKLPQAITALIGQRKSMVEYIGKLHDEIDLLLTKTTITHY